MVCHSGDREVIFFKGVINMATISGYDSNSIGVLFGSLNQTNSKSNSFSVSSDLLGINYADYNSIRSGSYFKLLNAYYGNNSSDEVKQAVSSTSTSKDDSKTLTKIESAADSMKDSAEALLQTGSKSLFKEVETKAEDGTTTKGYDTDAIYKAVKQFTSDYNDLLDEASESNTTSILRAANTMVNYSKVNQNLLAKVGITIGSDNKLSVDEETFKKADMSNVKALFQTRGSYGYQVDAQASLIESYAKTEAAKSNTYSQSGTYTYNYNTGELYSTGI